MSVRDGYLDECIIRLVSLPSDDTTGFGINRILRYVCSVTGAEEARARGRIETMVERGTLKFDKNSFLVRPNASLHTLLDELLAVRHETYHRPGPRWRSAPGCPMVYQKDVAKLAAQIRDEIEKL